MCGRFTHVDADNPLANYFRLATPKTTPRYNIAPTQTASVLFTDPETDKPRFQDLIWGLVPFWAKDKSIASRLINARAETVHEKPAFRAAFHHRRCLIPASGFYEWQGKGSNKTPYYFTPAGPHTPLILAGLWEDWVSGADHLRSFTILTVDFLNFLY